MRYGTADPVRSWRKATEPTTTDWRRHRMNSPMREAGRPSGTADPRLREGGPRHQRQTHEMAAEQPAEQLAAADSQRTDGGLIRASGVMAAGTLASRVTGFIRTAVIATTLFLARRRLQQREHVPQCRLRPAARRHFDERVRAASCERGETRRGPRACL